MKNINQKGITLVSLVVTIIVLIIISAISINTLVGQEGIITKAREEKNNLEKQIIKDDIQKDMIAKTSDMIIEKNDLIEILESYGEIQYKGSREIESVKTEEGIIISLSEILGNIEMLDKEFERNLLLDVARRYYTIDEIKQYIDITATSNKACFQMHFSDDQNVGIECHFLDQTKENAILTGNVYTNPATGKNFLTYEQVEEIMDYCKEKNVTFIPEIDIPGHMKGFFELARIKFGDEYVDKFARGTGREEGNIDIVQPEADEFIIAIYDEYTEFFKECKYFHMGFDEYTYRIDEKIDYINRMYKYLKEKGFVVSMWNDAITKENIEQLNTDIYINYWQYNGSGYATVPDFQERGFKVQITNPYYLFFVPSVDNTNEHDLNYTVEDIENNWTLHRWDLQNVRVLDTYRNILGGLICVWGEESAGVENSVILEQTTRMYNAMSKKLDIEW